ncbi:eukaryotic translation initiation factor 4E-binding protein 1-like [Halichondria panicea]|uniref:eukaryotic translation initiation factor 4E-binding protein 1-like n=1 Tax=Halichondria panicea TaxID=6063 RepID=UPI00312B88A6
MSTAPNLERQTSDSLSIPDRRVVIKDPTEMPLDYSTTPGGTMFSTTPGGTRIIYDRKFLLLMRNSPLARTPPPKLASIPDIINEDADPPEEKEETMSPEPPAPSKGVPENSETELFAMD